MFPNVSCAHRTRRAVCAVATLFAFAACGGDAASDAEPTTAVLPCANETTGITVPDGFCATVFADSLGHARHLVVANNGDVFVNTQLGGGRNAAPPPAGGMFVALRDTNGDGHADMQERFGDSASGVGIGGTGIQLYDGRLFVEDGARILRYAMNPSTLAPSGAPETVVTDLPTSGNHPRHPIAIDATGNLYVTSGSSSNACQVQPRSPESAGHEPCTELETRAGVWRYSASGTAQTFSAGERYATGIRNSVGMTIGPDGALWTTQHGRDQLAELWPALYTAEQSQEMPGEELMRVTEGDDFGWPYCYWDGMKNNALVLAPEYGGDGNAVGRCADKKAPAAAFPAHWAPNGVVFYTGTQFPERYRGGAFIAFHGSWNRAPGPQGGYNVTFQPMANGAASGPYEVFAEGFPGETAQPGLATYRPTGVTVGPDGALYVTDDQRGRIWRITYTGTAAR